METTKKTIKSIVIEDRIIEMINKIAYEDQRSFSWTVNSLIQLGLNKINKESK